MAEIRITQKERSLLPWLLAALLLGGLLWFLFAREANVTTASGVPADSVSRDTAAAAGTLAPGADSARIVPPR